MHTEPNFSQDPSVLILAGPTACGKTSLAIELAQIQKNIEIINTDRICFYQGLEIGSAKPTALEQKKVPHHLLSFLSPNKEFDAAQFIQKINQTLQTIENKKKKALLVGGSFFYLKALLFGLWKWEKTALKPSSSFRKKVKNFPTSVLWKQLCQKDPSVTSSLHAHDRYRIIRALELLNRAPCSLKQFQKNTPTKDPRFEIWFLDRSKEDLRSRIRTRTTQMLERGFLEEVKWLDRHYLQSPAWKAVGYQQARSFLKGIPPQGRKPKGTIEDLLEDIFFATWKLARKQKQWIQSLLPYGRYFLLDQDREILKKAFLKFYLS